jgi:hypothetical protein
MKSFYCTLDEAKREFNTDSDKDDAKVFALIPRISERLTAMGGHEFEPVFETRTFTLGIDAFDRQPGVLAISERVLEATAVSYRGQALTIGADVEIDVASLVRGTAFRFIGSVCRAYNACSEADRKRVSVTGWWGFRRRYSQEGWRVIDAVKNEGGLAAAATTLTVEAAQGLDADGFTPRISPGQLLRIGDEMLRAGFFQVEPETTLDDIPVLRGQRGTTAADHAKDAPVLAWSMEEDVKGAAQRWVSLSYQRIGVHETVTVTSVATVVMPTDAPEDAVNTMARYKRGQVAW